MATKKNTKNKTTPRKKSPEKKSDSNHLLVGIIFILIGLFSAYCYISFSAGIIGDLISRSFSYLFGGVTLFVTLYITIIGIILCMNKIDVWFKNLILIFLLLINLTMIYSFNIPNFDEYSIMDFFSLAQYGQYGGIIGILLYYFFTTLFSVKGTLLIIILTTFFIIGIIFKESIIKYIHYLKEKRKNDPSPKEKLSEKLEKMRDKRRIKKEIAATKNKESETTMIPPIVENEGNFPLFEVGNFEKSSVDLEPISLVDAPLFEPVMKADKIKKKKSKKDPFGFIDENGEEAFKIHENYFEDVNKRDIIDNTEDKTMRVSKKKIENEINEIESIDLTPKTEAYVFPKLSLLNLPSKREKSKKDDVLKKAKKIEETLKNFGVKAKIIEINVGPSITRFELQLDPGVKVNKIVNLSNDLALSLATSDIRIEAPIPGKAAVGIEVPNDVSEIVGLREIIDTDQFRNSKSPLTFALGKTLSGENVIGDIGSMPHVLIAGSTGSGKSVCINSIIVSMLYKSSPDDLRFIMIDPKMVELNQYNAIPHLLIPVVTDPKKAAHALNWGLKEMTDRYMIFKENNVRDIESYNLICEAKGEKKLPRIVIVIDELADLMITSPKEVENAICRIAQLARACGIHLVIATQRPSVDVITGLIKANIPSRIAFSVASNTDSRTILDTGGAEKLLGKGDMLYFPVGLSKPTRVQCTYLSDEEINGVINAIEIKKGVQYDSSIEEVVFQESEVKKPEKEGDSLLEEALKLGFEYDQLSTSMLQRKLQVGYARAGRIIDDLEERGFISGPNGSKPRNLLITEEDYLNNE
ncbi:MAG: DNA translocase FtsK [Eubacteriaceae bacterium]